mgnify:CR=1 FL=1
MQTEVVILAAGQGSRMKSTLPKVLHELAGKSMLGHVIEASNAIGATNTHIVIGHGAEKVREAFNNEVACVLNAENGQFIFQVPIKSFKFDISLMQEHFNENYVESEVYPKAVFKGIYKDGRAIGALSIHGVTKDVNVPAKLEVSEKSVLLNAQKPPTATSLTTAQSSTLMLTLK